MVAPGTPEAAETGRVGGIIHAKGLGYRYGQGAPVIQSVDLDIGIGEVVALVGPPGAGKTTLLELFSGELEATSGTLDVPPRRTAAGRLMQGYAPPAAVHFESLTGRENAVFFARAAGMRRPDAEASVAELLDTLGLGPWADRRLAGYPPSARRKLLLVEALAHRPALALLDEPFQDLDQAAQEALVHLLRFHSAKRGSVVVASRKLGFIPEMVDRVLFVHEGRIVAGGRIAELFASVGGATRIEVELERRPKSLDVRFRADVIVVSDGEPLVVETMRGQAAVPEVCAALVAAGAVVKDVTVREAHLGEVFRRATGVELPL